MVAGRPMKVHGDLQGHRTKAELAKRAKPMRKPPVKYLYGLVFATRQDRDDFKSWLDQLWNDERQDCICQ